MCRARKKNGYYDRFRNRIIFPIFDHSAAVVGFGGRVMDDARPKYLNSPETPLYNKSRSLYGLHRAREACRASRSAFIVEGYFDLLALHQHGIGNAVATLGTSLTPEHMQILKGLVGKNGKVVLVYDSDVAGIKAAHRSIEVFEKSFVDANILILPEGHDPDSFLFEFGREAFDQRAADALGVIPFLIETAVQTHGLTVEGKVRIIAALKMPIAALEDAMARTLYVKELAERIEVPEAAVLEKVRQASTDRAGGRRNRSAVAAGRPPSESACEMVADTDAAIRYRGSRIERRIIAMMLQFPEILPEIAKRKVVDSIEDDTLKSIGQCILDNRSCADNPVAELTRRIAAGGQRELLSLLAIEEDCWDREGCLKLLMQFEISRSRSRDELLNRIKAAEAADDQNLLRELLQQKQSEAQKRVSRCR